MKKGEKYLLGGLLIVLGVAIGWNSISMTGNVVGSSNQGIGSILGLALIIGGMLVFLAKDRGDSEGGLEKETKTVKRLEEIRDSGSVGSYNELYRLANKIEGLTIREAARHANIYSGGVLVTRIPRHARNVKKGTYLRIVRDLLAYAS
jgi:hypothetical protein